MICDLLCIGVHKHFATRDGLQNKIISIYHLMIHSWLQIKFE